MAKEIMDKTEEARPTALQTEWDEEVDGPIEWELDTGPRRAGLWRKLLHREVDQPTHRVYGPFERFDDRDVVFARGILEPGSREYEHYYAVRHPERKQGDERFRIFYNRELAAKRRAEIWPDEPLQLALSKAAGMIPPLLGDKVLGPVAGEKVKVDPEEMALKIKGLGKYFGASVVKICRLNPAWFYSRKGRWYYFGERWGDPIRERYEYAITLGYPHSWDFLLAGRDINQACNIDSGHLYSLMAEVSVRMAAFIRALGYRARAQHVANYTVMQVPIAIDAGMGEISRMGFLVSKDWGPSLRLVTVTTDLPMAVDKPVDIGMIDFCERCGKCAGKCPVGCIPEGPGKMIKRRGAWVWQIDADKCYAFWNSKGTNCFQCMSVCPWTKPDNLLHKVSRELAARSSLIRRLLIRADDIFYGKLPAGHPFPPWLQYSRHRKKPGGGGAGAKG